MGCLFVSGRKYFSSRVKLSGARDVTYYMTILQCGNTVLGVFSLEEDNISNKMKTNDFENLLKVISVRKRSLRGIYTQISISV